MREQLRKAGQAIRAMDDRYSDAILKNDRIPVPIKMITGMPVTYKPEVSTIEYLGKPGQTTFVDKDQEPTMTQMRTHQAMEQAMAAGLMASSAATRYGAPLTAAGLALNALSTQFGGQADMPESNQLPLQ